MHVPTHRSVIVIAAILISLMSIVILIFPPSASRTAVLYAVIGGVTGAFMSLCGVSVVKHGWRAIIIIQVLALMVCFIITALS